MLRKILRQERPLRHTVRRSRGGQKRRHDTVCVSVASALLAAAVDAIGCEAVGATADVIG